MYLRKHIQTFGEVSFTLNKLLNECGYSTNSHNSSIYDDFRNIISKEIISKGYASSQDDIMKISPSNIYTMTLSYNKLIFYSDKNFVSMTIKEFETIVNSDSGKMNKSTLAGVYLYIKQFIFTDTTYDNIVHVSYPSKRQIMLGIGLSSQTTVESAISKLEELKMIFVRRNLYIEDSNETGIYIPARNIFALDENGLYSDAALSGLENIYNRKVYEEKEVIGKIKYLVRE